MKFVAGAYHQRNSWTGIISGLIRLAVKGRSDKNEKNKNELNTDGYSPQYQKDSKHKVNVVR
ncbi:hypothetical protein BN8_00542 [Fibrisoma limi BUZ 3]|uniref:Uncharacterized protein n=1 Tax=Fibrisoma limi BUZ 3 TaxID=1185876 RepID=I2GCH9_9BACT|nr:hypothetical protein BN8_00542 [Fibrisoma limi BUZ 3]